MKVVVTGGGGFIGSAVVRELEQRGHEAYVCDRQADLDILTTDLTDVFYGEDAVIHLAGILGTAELFDWPEEAIDVNVKGTARVLRAAASEGLSYVGITMPEVWDNIYQATKHAARKLASAYHRHYNIPVSHVRAFNVFGPGQKVGKPQKIVPTFSHRAWRNLPIPIWGDGKQTVDLVYVDDVARMLVDALDFGDDQVFDAGTGISITVNAVCDYILSMTKSLGGVEELPMRKGEHPAHVHAKGEGWEALGWHPMMRWDQLHETVTSYRPRVIVGRQ